MSAQVDARGTLLVVYEPYVRDRLAALGMPTETGWLGIDDLPRYAGGSKGAWIDTCHAAIERAIERKAYWWPWSEIA